MVRTADYADQKFNLKSDNTHRAYTAHGLTAVLLLLNDDVHIAGKMNTVRTMTSKWDLPCRSLESDPKTHVTIVVWSHSMWNLQNCSLLDRCRIGCTHTTNSHRYMYVHLSTFYQSVGKFPVLLTIHYRRSYHVESESRDQVLNHEN
jgi:hypothetical protein